MLSRELCEKLAEAYPEAIGKNKKPAVKYYYVTKGEPRSVSLNLHSVEGEDVLYCPSLEDLLVIAVDQVVPPGPKYVSLENSSPSLMLDPGWSFGVPAQDDEWDDSLPVREASTPEEAIALWLLDMSDKERKEAEGL